MYSRTSNSIHTHTPSPISVFACLHFNSLNVYGDPPLVYTSPLAAGLLSPQNSRVPPLSG